MRRDRDAATYDSSSSSIFSSISDPGPRGSGPHPHRRRGHSPLSRTTAFIAGAALAATALIVANPLAEPASAGTPDTMAYFSDGVRPGTITAYNVTTGAVAATIQQSSEVGYPPEMAYNPNGTAVYLAQSIPDGTTDIGMLGVLSTTTNTVFAEIPIGNGPTGLAVSPDGDFVYVADGLSDTVSVINTTNYSVAATIPVGGYPSGVAVSPDGSTLYVTNYFDGTVSVINADDYEVTGTINLGSAQDGPMYVKFTPNGASAYVTDNVSSAVSVINTATRTVTATIPNIGGPIGIAVSPDGSTVYTADANSGEISVISTADNTVTENIATSPLPVEAALTPDGSALYVTGFVDGTSDPGAVSVIDTATDTVTSSTSSIPGAYSVAMMPGAWVSGVTPDGGPQAGGNQVTITGTDFAEATAVDFGGVPASSYTIDSPTTITATAPPGGSGIVNVTVTTPTGISAVNAADEYDHQGAPTVTDVSPGFGLPAGGPTVTITGTGFYGTVTVLFGSTPAEQIYSQTLTTLKVESPPGAAGTTVDVTVTTSGGTSAVTATGDTFYYFELTHIPTPIPRL
jgi:YVTN family beta-propeller protein